MRTLSALLAATTISAVVGCSQSVDHTEAIERHKLLATELRDNRLYEAAVQEYQKILTYEDIETTVRANINYLIGRLYFEHINDYEQAAAYYVRARALDPSASFADEAGKNLVAALERSGNVADARRQLQTMTDIDAEPASDTDVVVARISGSPIWLSQVNDALANMPPEQQRQIEQNPQAKIDFVHQYVASELLYRAAMRENYNNDPEIKKQVREISRQLLVEKYLFDNVMPKVRIDTVDVKNFYAANRDSLYGGAPYDSVKARVFMDYQSQKAQSAYRDYINTLSQKDRVEFFDQNVK